MLSSRIRRVQQELQSHQNWLRSFTGTHWTHQFHPSNRRTFSSSHVGAEAQKQKQKQFFGKPRTAWQKKQRRNQDRVQHVALGTLSQKEELLQAVKDYDIKQVAALYASLPEKKPLTPEDLFALAQCVHQCLRQETYKVLQTKEREDLNEIVAFATQLVKDIRKERLLPHIYAHVHLLGVFKESGTYDGGIKFWEWLQAQDEEYVNADVYSVAIDLLARTGTPLEELEQLYEDALARFPGTFNAYHLSPNAILEDREHEFPVKGVPMSLLLSITVARLLGGDSHKAYLAFDTALRLYPTTAPTRFFAIFKDERPLSEFFTVFAIACRAGIQLPVAYYKLLVSRLRQSSDLKSVSVHLSALRAMLAATHLQFGAKGTIHANTVNELTIAVIQTVRLPSLSSLEAKERRELVDEILGMVKQMLGIFARYGALPGEALFNSIITNIGGFSGDKSVISIALADMKALEIEASDITRRSILIAAGVMQDADLLQSSWKDISESRGKRNACPDVADLHALVTAARRANLIDFARNQLELVKESIDAKDHAVFEDRFAKSPDEPEKSDASLDSVAPEISEGIAGLKKEIADLDSATKDRSSVQDLSGKSLSMALIPPPDWLRLSYEEMRNLYDEFTTEQRPSTSPAKNRDAGVTTSSSPLPESQESSPSPVSTTNIPFGTLRFQNWEAVNYLLWLSRKHDDDYNSAVDRAISAGMPPPRRQRGMAYDELMEMRPFSFEEMRPKIGRESPIYHARLHQAKNEVYRLRDKTTT
ncbi:hypothetical protein M409DRAFT_16143 [Zasmidium cellare ATCC 36951]|uniref:Uncharacterized protein n=1 Tax=Zasmidium cellare ATCC 36951 TaxID=1080233 RepID=A0A6A6D390_ZASCE|nr:uncharacterized protein M409DRAFT_16143 [Zasmidium cellare ATCC 36951]KAF2173874.1 hypothetical protein M409DRAFT_16143 [Zasmidium cellare ATCC 36951]